MKLLKTLPLLCAAAVLSACAHTPADNSHAAPAAKESAMQETYAVTSRYGFNETVRRLETAITGKGMEIFTVIDHQAAARKHNLTMQPAKVIIFGNPKAGTPLMAKDPQFAFNLPLRVLVTETGGNVQVVFYNVHSLIEGSRIGFADVENTLAKTEGLIRQTVTE